MQPAGVPAVRLAGGWVATLVPVRVACNLRALTVEEVLAQTKELHLAAARFGAARLHLDLREEAEDGRLRRRLEGDGARGGLTVEEVLEKLERGAGEVMAAHEAEPAEQYLDHAEHRRLAGEALDARAHALSALRLYLEDPARDVARIMQLPNPALHREYVAFLRRTLPPAAEEGGRARRQAAERLCVIAGLAVERTFVRVMGRTY